MQRGTLFLVVGPSGAGKDTLLDAAKAHLKDDPRFFFPPRLITRPAAAGGEAHTAVTAGEFAALKAAGTLLLEWPAHGLSYGIPATAADALSAGRHVVANVSRGVLDEARQSLQPVRILSIEVPVPILRARLESRGREQAGDIEQRLHRAMAFKVAGPDVTVIPNGGTLEHALQRFLQALLV